MAVTRTVAIEGGCFVLNTSQFISKEGLEANKVHGISVEGDAEGGGHIVAGGGMTCVYGPDGSQITDPIPDDAETIVYAELDTDRVHHAALVQDTVGHYSRPDIFQLVVNKTPAPRVVHRLSDGSFAPIEPAYKSYKDLDPVE